MIRYDCDGTTGEGCCADLTRRICWQCRVRSEIRLRMLATNLAHAGSLCEAFWQGWLGRGGQGSTDCPADFDVWMPGCNLAQSG